MTNRIKTPVGRSVRTVIILSLAALVSCDSNARGPAPLVREPGPSVGEFDHATNDPIKLAGTLFSDDPALGLPGRMTFASSHLIVVDFSGDPFLHVLDMTGVVVRSFGRRGEGPGEFQSTMGLTFDRNGQLWAYDSNLRRLTAVSVNGTDGAETIRLEPGQIVLRTHWVKDSIVGIGIADSVGFMTFSRDGKRTGAVSRTFLGGDSIPADQRMRATVTGFGLCTGPQDGGFAVAHFHAGVVEFYDEQRSRIALAQSPYPSEPHFVIKKDNQLALEGKRRWYNDCVRTRKHVYALFSGRHSDVFPTEQGQEARFVHVFKWPGGELEDVFELDRLVFGIAVDEDGHRLYAGSISDAAIYSFKLPD